jgi:hypothetical protein
MSRFAKYFSKRLQLHQISRSTREAGAGAAVSKEAAAVPNRT